MRRRLLPIIAILASVVVATFLAGAQDCVPSTAPHLAAIAIPGVTTFYFARDCDGLDISACRGWGASPLQFYPYQEANGIEGLQRQDGERDDTCGIVEPDTLLL